MQFSKYKALGSLYLEGPFNGGFFELLVGGFIFGEAYMEGLIGNSCSLLQVQYSKINNNYAPLLESLIANTGLIRLNAAAFINFQRFRCGVCFKITFLKSLPTVTVNRF